MNDDYPIQDERFTTTVSHHSWARESRAVCECGWFGTYQSWELPRDWAAIRAWAQAREHYADEHGTLVEPPSDWDYLRLLVALVVSLAAPFVIVSLLARALERFPVEGLDGRALTIALYGILGCSVVAIWEAARYVHTVAREEGTSHGAVLTNWRKNELELELGLVFMVGLHAGATFVVAGAAHWFQINLASQGTEVTALLAAHSDAFEAIGLWGFYVGLTVLVVCYAAYLNGLVGRLTDRDARNVARMGEFLSQAR